MSFNKAKLNQYLSNFKAYIEHKDNRLLTASAGLKGNAFFMHKKQEGYKEIVYADARKALQADTWSLVDCNAIIEHTKMAIVNKSQNLIFANQKTHFQNKNKDNPQRAAEILYNLYIGDDFETSFNDAIAFWGAKYDLVAYLFFIKDKTRYLPISPGNFDEIFAKLEINLTMSHRCSSANYLAFVRNIDELRKYMVEFFGFEVSLLEAHSVIWMMNSVESFTEENSADARLLHEVNISTNEEYDTREQSDTSTARETPAIINGQKVYPRSKSKALAAMANAHFNCELNPNHESFIRKNSNTKYLEPHHLIPMSQSENFNKSLDTTANIVCLCSNCHNEIHYGKDSEILIRQLFEHRKKRLDTVGIKTTIEQLLKMY